MGKTLNSLSREGKRLKKVPQFSITFFHYLHYYTYLHLYTLTFKGPFMHSKNYYYLLFYVFGFLFKELKMKNIPVNFLIK